MVTRNAEIKRSRTRRDKKTEIQTSGIRRDKETGECRVDSKQCGGIGQSSRKTGSESITTNRDDWSWRNFINSYGQANIGGILNRLILHTKHQIEESEERIADLRQQLAELQQISDEFFQEDSE